MAMKQKSPEGVRPMLGCCTRFYPSLRHLYAWGKSREAHSRPQLPHPSQPHLPLPAQLPRYRRTLCNIQVLQVKRTYFGRYKSRKQKRRRKPGMEGTDQGKSNFVAHHLGDVHVCVPLKHRNSKVSSMSYLVCQA